mmetsp:Transcript_21896/g.57149  ORF Transcript_21896/g.57149 Transcript_21896/m.57149 type:complete len:224 (+) Transcript_21896:764-1435(+)
MSPSRSFSSSARSILTAVARAALRSKLPEKFWRAMRVCSLCSWESCCSPAGARRDSAASSEKSSSESSSSSSSLAKLTAPASKDKDSFTSSDDFSTAFLLLELLSIFFMPIDLPFFFFIFAGFAVADFRIIMPPPKPPPPKAAGGGAPPKPPPPKVAGGGAPGGIGAAHAARDGAGIGAAHAMPSPAFLALARARRRPPRPPPLTKFELKFTSDGSCGTGDAR